MKQSIVLLLSGATIPLAFFPEKFRAVVEWLPFKSIYDTPLTLLLNDDLAPEVIWSKLGIACLWAIAMSLFSNLFWKISVRQVTVNGG